MRVADIRYLLREFAAKMVKHPRRQLNYKTANLTDIALP